MYARPLEQADRPERPTLTVSVNPELIRLLILREIEASGPMTGLDAFNHVAPTVRLLGAEPPGYALLHELTDAGFLEPIEEKPRRYRITESGSAEAELLALRSWPRFRKEVSRLGRQLAPASSEDGET